MARPNRSWMLEGSQCECGSDVVVTQGAVKDYRYYCSNPDCSHHTEVHDLYDQDEPPSYVKPF